MPRNWNTVPGGTTIQNGETLWLNPNGTTWESHKFATTKSDVGLGNVDNTSDADKPISNATQAALDNIPVISVQPELPTLDPDTATMADIVAAYNDLRDTLQNAGITQ